jgi:hypothetical protein
LVGSDILSTWYNGRRGGKVDIDALPYAKNPALDAYIASLVNLRLFDIPEEVAEPESDEDVQPTRLQDLSLSDLGQKVAAAFAKAVKSTSAEQIIRDGAHKAKDDDLIDWGKRGGLCELRSGGPDRPILREIFFNRVGLESMSHTWRRNTLLLMLHLADELEKHDVPLDQETFGEAVYFGKVRDSNDTVWKVTWPDVLADVAARWRMFYFHYYLSAVLENLFIVIVSHGNLKRLEGFRLEALLEPLSKAGFNRAFRKLIGVNYDGAFSDLTPAKLYTAAGVPVNSFDEADSRALEKAVPLEHPLSEAQLHSILDQRERYGTDEAVALAAILCSGLCLRYLQWENTPYGGWLAKAAGDDDPYQNVTVPVVVRELRLHYGDALNVPFRDLLLHILHRFVIRLHLTLAYQKSGSFFFMDDERIRGRGKRYETPTYGNGRFFSGILILKDLGLLEEQPDSGGLRHRTADGDALLAEELKAGTRG